MGNARMTDLHQIELMVNLILQGLGGWLTAPMKAFSFLGTEEFFLILMPALFWCVNPGIGLRTVILLIANSAANGGLKIAFHAARPYWIDLRVHAFSAETSFGLPSNHAQTAAAIWGYLAFAFRKKWILATCAAVILMIGLSRLYLGVHFLSDVLLGWLIGLLLLWLMLRLDAPVSAWIKRASFSQLMVASAASTFVLAVFFLFPWLLARNWPIPPEWASNALSAAPGTPIDPFKIDDAFSFAGLWLGMTAGAAWKEKMDGGYSAGGTISQKILRYLVGMVGVLILWYGLGQVFPREANLVAYLLRFFRYGLVSLWVSALAPLLFRRLNLTVE